MVTNIAHEFEWAVIEEKEDDQARDVTDAVSLLGLPRPGQMLNAPATAIASNGVNGDNECRRQRSIYTAFEKARATHVCFFFRSVGTRGLKFDLLQSSYQGSCVYVCNTQN